MKKFILLVSLFFGLAPAGHALECYQANTWAASVTTQLPNNLYVLASTGDGYVIWSSGTITQNIECYSAYNEVISFWVNPKKTQVGQGVEVGIVYNGITYTQSSGSIPTGYKTDEKDLGSVSGMKKAFSISYSLVLLRKGTVPSTGSTNISSYSVFQLDGAGGVNPAAAKNFSNMINGSIKFTRGTCLLRVGDATKTVALQPAFAQKLPALGGTTGRVPFSLEVQNCDEGVKGASFTFAGTPDSNNAKAFANTGTAKGVAIYMGNAADNTAIPPSGTGNSRVASIVGSRGSLDLYAEYVVTGQLPTAGSVNSKATFTISYQ